MQQVEDAMAVDDLGHAARPRGLHRVEQAGEVQDFLATQLTVNLPIPQSETRGCHAANMRGKEREYGKQMAYCKGFVREGSEA